MEENLEYIYNELGGDTTFGNIDTFKKGLNDDANLDYIYNKLGGESTFKDINTFKRGLGITKPKALEEHDLGSRNNNPFNLRPYKEDQPSMEHKNGKFRVFDTIEDGYAAGVADLEAKIGNKSKNTPIRSHSTVAELLEVWSPAKGIGNTSKSTQGYIDHVGKILGVDPYKTTIAEVGSEKLANAMIQHESPDSYDRLSNSSSNNYAEIPIKGVQLPESVIEKLSSSQYYEALSKATGKGDKRDFIAAKQGPTQNSYIFTMPNGSEVTLLDTENASSGEKLEAGLGNFINGVFAKGVIDPLGMAVGAIEDVAEKILGVGDPNWDNFYNNEVRKVAEEFEKENTTMTIDSNEFQKVNNRETNNAGEALNKSLEKLTHAESWIDGSAGDALESMVSFMLPGIGAAKVTGKVLDGSTKVIDRISKLTTLNKKSVRGGLQGLIASQYMALTESGVEAREVYKQALEHNLGKYPEEEAKQRAANAASEAFGVNHAILSGSNALEMAIILNPYTRTFTKMGMAVLGGAAAEGVQEGLQYGITENVDLENSDGISLSNVLPKVYNSAKTAMHGIIEGNEEAIESTLLGALMGGGAAAASSINSKYKYHTVAKPIMKDIPAAFISQTDDIYVKQNGEYVLNNDKKIIDPVKLKGHLKAVNEQADIENIINTLNEKNLPEVAEVFSHVGIGAVARKYLNQGKSVDEIKSAFQLLSKDEFKKIETRLSYDQYKQHVDSAFTSAEEAHNATEYVKNLYPKAKETSIEKLYKKILFNNKVKDKISKLTEDKAKLQDTIGNDDSLTIIDKKIKGLESLLSKVDIKVKQKTKKEEEEETAQKTEYATPEETQAEADKRGVDIDNVNEIKETAQAEDPVPPSDNEDELIESLTTDKPNREIYLRKLKNISAEQHKTAPKDINTRYKGNKALEFIEDRIFRNILRKQRKEGVDSSLTFLTDEGFNAFMKLPLDDKLQNKAVIDVYNEYHNIEDAPILDPEDNIDLTDESGPVIEEEVIISEDEVIAKLEEIEPGSEDALDKTLNYFNSLSPSEQIKYRDKFTTKKTDINKTKERKNNNTENIISIFSRDEEYNQYTSESKNNRQDNSKFVLNLIEKGEFSEGLQKILEGKVKIGDTLTQKVNGDAIEFFHEGVLIGAVVGRHKVLHQGDYQVTNSFGYLRVSGNLKSYSKQENYPERPLTETIEEANPMFIMSVVNDEGSLGFVTDPRLKDKAWSEPNLDNIQPGFTWVMVKDPKGSYVPARVSTPTVEASGMKNEILKAIEGVDNDAVRSLKSMVSWKGMPNISTEKGHFVVNEGGSISMFRTPQEVYDYLDIDSRPIQISISDIKKKRGSKIKKMVTSGLMPPRFGSHFHTPTIKAVPILTDKTTEKSPNTESLNVNFDDIFKTDFIQEDVIDESIPEEVPQIVPEVVVKPVEPVKPKETVDDLIDRLNNAFIGEQGEFKLSSGDGEFIPEDDAKARAWFKSVFPEVPYEISDDQIDRLYDVYNKGGQKIWGVFKEASVILAENRPEGTTRHEAFHVAFNLFATPQERTSLLKQAFEKWGDELGITKEEFEQALIDGNASDVLFSKVDYSLNAVEILQSNKAEQVFAKGKKNGWDLNKILTELQIPKEQKQIILDKYKYKVSEQEFIKNFDIKPNNETHPEDANTYDVIYKGNKIGIVALFEGKNKTIKGVNLEEKYRNKGLGKQLYKYLNYLANKNGGVLTSDPDQQSESARRLWGSLIKEGVVNKAKADEQVLKFKQNNLREDIITSLLAENSFVVEVNTAKKSFGINPYTEKEEFGDNTQHYSNLTVPGGINYTENEISTPNITPNIKGHAQFSTDNGIGWFRSDDLKGKQKSLDNSQQDIINELGGSFSEEATGLEDTKTRRILELQSDLFQKGRDKKELVNTPGIYGEGLPEDYNNIQENQNQNQFLQILNKKNNWVTFFIKSIIQDSAKKGYEKVLFPKGDTAAKIEGHETLESFKNSREKEIKKSEDKIKEYDKILSKKNTDIDDTFGTPEIDKTKRQKESALAYINILKQEIKDVESGQTQLSSIAKFYEDTLTNILKKQGYSPVKVTDEHGNTWNEVTLTEDLKKKVNKIRLSSGTGSKNKKLNTLVRLEEKLAEEFADLKESLGVPRNPIQKILKQVYDFIFDKLGQVKRIFKDPTIDEFFKLIDNKTVGRDLLGRVRKPFKAGGVRYSTDLNTNRKISVVNRDLLPRLVRGYGKNNLKELLDGQKDQVETIKNLYKTLAISLGKNAPHPNVKALSEEILNEIENFSFGESSLLRSLILDLKNSHGVSFKVNLQTELEDDIHETFKENWQIQYLQTNPLDNISNNIRHVLSKIPRTRTVSENGKMSIQIERDPLYGSPVYINSSVAFSLLARNISNSLSVQQMMNKIDKLAETNSWAQTVKDLLEKDESLQKDMFTSLAGNTLAHPLTVIRKKKEVKVYKSDRRGVIKSMIEDFKNKYSTKTNLKNIFGTVLNKLESETDPQRKRYLVSQTFSYYGVDLNHDSIDNIIDKRLIRNMFSKLEDAIFNNDGTFKKDPFKDIAGTQVRLKEFFKTVQDNDMSLGVVSYLDVEGKPHYINVPNSYMWRALKQDYSNYKDYEGFRNIDMYDWVQQGDVSMFILDGVKENGRGVKYKNFTPLQDAVTTLNVWATTEKEGNPAYRISTLSDSPVTYFLQLPDMELADTIAGLEKSFEAEKEFLSFLGGESHYFKGVSSKKDIIKFMDTQFNNELIHLQKIGVISKTDNTYTPAESLSSAWANNFEEKLRKYFYQHYYMNIQMNTFFAGHPNSYKNSGDFQKRFKQIHATGKYGIWDSPTYSAKTVEDITLPSENLVAMVDGKVDYENSLVYNLLIDQGIDVSTAKLVADAYSNNDITDGQSFHTLDRRRDIEKAYNTWSPKKEELFNRLKRIEELENAIESETNTIKKLNAKKALSDIQEVTITEQLLAFAPLKPHYFSKVAREITDDKGVTHKTLVPTQHKNSEATFIPAFTKLGEFKKIKDLFNKTYKDVDGVDTKLDVLHFKSAVKVGNLNVHENFDSLLEDDSIELFENQHWKIQSEVPVHVLDTTNRLGTQGRKHILANISGEYNIPGLGVKTAQKIKDLFNEYIGENILEDLGKLDIKDIHDIKRLAAESILELGIGDQFLEGLELVDRNGKTEFAVPLWHPSSSNKVQSVVNGFFKEVIKQKFNGGSFVNIASVGFEDLKIQFNSSGGIDHYEVMLPSYMKGITEIGQILDEKLLKGIVTRIPTESKYSMFPIKVKGFLPNYYGNSIAMPREITTVAGMDFDIDKVFAMFYNHEIVDGKAKVIKSGPETKKSRENAILDIYLAILTDKKSLFEMLNPGGFQRLIKMASAKKVKNENLNLALPSTQNTYSMRNMAGVSAIGIMANSSAFHSLTEGLGILAPDLGIEGLSSEFSPTKDSNDMLTSLNFAEPLAASVDNAKDPVLGILNINSNTINVFNYLMHRGVSLEKAIDFINKPIIKEYVDFVDLGGNISQFRKVRKLYGKEKSITSNNPLQTLNAFDTLFEESFNFRNLVESLRVDGGNAGPNFVNLDAFFASYKQAIVKYPSASKILPIIKYKDGKFFIESAPNKSISSFYEVLVSELNVAHEHVPYFNTGFIQVKSRVAELANNGRNLTVNQRKIINEHIINFTQKQLYPIESVKNFVTLFPSRFIKEIPKTSEYFNLIEAIKLEDIGDTGFKKLTLRAAGYSAEDRMQLIAEFKELLKKSPVLANDLIKYNFYTTGFSFKRDNFSSIIPPEYIKDNIVPVEDIDTDLIEAIAYNVIQNFPKQLVKEDSLDNKKNAEFVYAKDILYKLQGENYTQIQTLGLENFIEYTSVSEFNNNRKPITQTDTTFRKLC